MFQKKKGVDKEKEAVEYDTCKIANGPLQLQHNVYIVDGWNIKARKVDLAQIWESLKCQVMAYELHAVNRDESTKFLWMEIVLISFTKVSSAYNKTTHFN